MESVRNLIRICQRHGYMQPNRCSVAGQVLTSSNYGPLGTLLRQNIISEWWRHLLRNEQQIFPVENSPWVPQRNTLSSNIGDTDETTVPDCHHRDSLTQGMLQHYLSTLKLVNHSIPFGIAQVGACQKEWDPLLNTDNTFQWSNMVEELSLLHFVAPSAVSQWLDHWKRTRLHWWKKFAGSTPGFSITENEGENSNNSLKKLVIMYKFPWGEEEVETIENLGEAPLGEIQNQLGISCQGRFGKKLVMPQVIECRAVLEKGMVAYLHNAYRPQDDARAVLKLHPRISPYMIAVCCTGKLASTTVRGVAEHVKRELQLVGISVLDLHTEGINVQKQFVEHDEMGVPYTLILNDSTLDNGIAYLRNRDTNVQEQVSIAEVPKKMKIYLDAEQS